jgi:hypothetical protein
VHKDASAKLVQRLDRKYFGFYDSHAPPLCDSPWPWRVKLAAANPIVVRIQSPRAWCPMMPP